MKYRLFLGLLSLLLLGISACRQPSQLPTRAATAAPLLNQGSGGQSETSTMAPTQTAEATLTPSPTPLIPTIAPTPFFGSGINITTPNAGTELLHGSEVVAGGLVQLGAGQTLSVTLVSATGFELAQAAASISAVNSWQATLIVPVFVQGPADLKADILDPTGTIIVSDRQPVTLVANPDDSDRYLTLFRPLDGSDVVGGFNLFFDGRAQLPVKNIVTISVWHEDCRTEAARQQFVLSGSGYWQGFIVVPPSVNGPACAVAYFGAPGDDNWREAQVRVNVLPRTDKQATGVLIGNPPPESVLAPGQRLLLYGTAYNAPENLVMISLLLENGRVLNEVVTGTDTFGYWEVELFVPADADGPALLSASTGDPGGENFSEHQVTVTIGLTS